MSENIEVFNRASSWSVMRELRPVLNDFAQVKDLNMSDLSNHERLEVLFASYFGSLASESQRFDRPECLVYYRLAQICSPAIFRNPLGADIEEGLKYLQSPISDITNPLYVISRETQNLDPGRVRLLSARVFFPGDTLPANLHPVILECDIEGGRIPRVARVPLVLTGDPAYDNFTATNMPTVSRVAEVLRSFGGSVELEVKHLPYLKSKMKDLQIITHSRELLDWPLEFTGIPLATPIVGALLGDPRLDQDHTLLQSVSIATGETLKSWEVMRKSWMLLPDSERWKYWSFNNTVFQMRNVATENMLALTSRLSADILNLQGVESDKSFRTATLAVHLPILAAAAFANNIPGGVVAGLSQHQAEEEAIIRKRQDDESRFWGSYV